MTSASFKTFIKPSKGDYFIAAIPASEILEFARSNVVCRELTDKEMEAISEAFMEEALDERCAWMRVAIECGLKAVEQNDADPTSTDF